MNSTIVFKGETMTITHQAPHGYLQIHWAGLTRSNEYREAWNIALQVAQEQKVTCWLLNQKEMNIYPDDLKWVVENWFPRYYQSLKTGGRWAVVVSKSLFGEYQVKKEADKLANDNESFQREYFREVSEAEVWLLKGKQ